jgi:sRNA-binding regulator protein Hfq
MTKEKWMDEAITVLKKIQNNCTFHHDGIDIQTFITNGFELEQEIESLVDKWNIAEIRSSNNKELFE